MTGRSFTGPESRGRPAAPGYRAEAVDRNTLLWTMVVFFGASLLFSTIRDAADEDGIGVSLAAQLAAGLLLVAFIVLVMRRR
jgi:threonine/homoserine efflux transporter RhtA